MTEIGRKDTPVESSAEDKLGLSHYVDALSEFARRCPTPMTIAIQGDWGSGKTSTMNMIRASLKEYTAEIAGDVWFNTWQYSQLGRADDLPVQLISVFAEGLRSKLHTQSDGRTALDKVRKLVVGVARAGVISAVALANKDIADVIESEWTTPETASMSLPDRAKQLREELGSLVAKALESAPDSRYIIFIDDLDRIVPARAVEVLEILKIFLDIPGCVFILACDYEVISRGLRDKFGDMVSERGGKQFFDKIIQLPFSMPVGQFSVGAYIRSLLGDIGGEIPDNEIDLYSALLGNSVGFNPRSLKRITNSLQILSLVARNKGLFTESDAAGKHARHRILLGFVCMQTAFDPVYRKMVESAQSGTRSLTAAVKFDWSRVSQSADGTSSTSSYERDPDFLAAAVECERQQVGSLNRLGAFMRSLFAAAGVEDDKQDDELEGEKLRVFAEMLRLSSVTSVGVQDPPALDFQKDVLVKPALALRRLLEEKGKQINLIDHAYEIDEKGLWIGARFRYLTFKPWFCFAPDGSCLIGMDVWHDNAKKARDDAERLLPNYTARAKINRRSYYQFMQIPVVEKGSFKLDPAPESVEKMQTLLVEHYLPFMTELSQRTLVAKE
jgi:hypothetical protein